MNEERVHELLYSCDSRTELCEMIARLEDENAKLQASNEVIAEDHAALCEHNAKLQEYVQTLEAANLDVTSRLQDYIGQHDPTDAFVIEAKAENAKLRELCADMYGFIKRMDEDCGDVTFSDCFDYCNHDTADDGCCKTGECWYEQRMRELGIEVK